MVENITPCGERGGEGVGELGGLTPTVVSSLHRSRDNPGPGFGVRVENITPCGGRGGRGGWGIGGFNPHSGESLAPRLTLV